MRSYWGLGAVSVFFRELLVSMSVIVAEAPVISRVFMILADSAGGINATLLVTRCNFHGIIPSTALAVMRQPERMEYVIRKNTNFIHHLRPVL